MRMNEAVAIINMERTGYMVHFEHVEGSILRSDHFPDKHAGEALIGTEEEAWVLAAKFAAATVGKCVNFYVIGSDFRPVPRYAERMIVNRAGARSPVCICGYGPIGGCRVCDVKPCTAAGTENHG